MIETGPTRAKLEVHKLDVGFRGSAGPDRWHTGWDYAIDDSANSTNFQTSLGWRSPPLRSLHPIFVSQATGEPLRPLLLPCRK